MGLGIIAFTYYLTQQMFSEKPAQTVQPQKELEIEIQE